MGDQGLSVDAYCADSLFAFDAALRERHGCFRESNPPEIPTPAPISTTLADMNFHCCGRYFGAGESVGVETTLVCPSGAGNNPLFHLFAVTLLCEPHSVA